MVSGVHASSETRLPRWVIAADLLVAAFFLIGAIWFPALICVGVTVVFLFLMFFIERGAEAADKRQAN